MKIKIIVILLILIHTIKSSEQIDLQNEHNGEQAEPINRFGNPAVLCNLMVKGLLQTGCLQVCQNATINGDLTVKGTITPSTNNFQTAFLVSMDVSSTVGVVVLSITVNTSGTYYANATMSASKNAGDTVNIRLLKNATLGTQPQIITTDSYAIGAPTALGTQGFLTVSAGDTIDLFVQVDPITNYTVTDIRLNIMQVA